MGFMSFFGRRTPAALPSTDGVLAREQMLASLLVTAWVVEARDPYTGGHLWRVSRYAALLCEHAGIPKKECARISLGGFLHDLGKIGIPDAILRKRGTLTEGEVAIVRTHPEVGARLLAVHPLAGLVRDAVMLHHETPDGGGYPGGISGHSIPMAARIVGICDAFDAMTSTRPYRAGMPIPQALEVIESRLGRQFDETIGRQFLALGADGLLDHIAGHSDDGIPLQPCAMCDAALVVRREQVAGDSLFCRNCGGGYRLRLGRDNALLEAVPSGGQARASDLEPIPDVELIRRLVHDTASALFADALPPTTPKG